MPAVILRLLIHIFGFIKPPLYILLFFITYLPVTAFSALFTGLYKNLSPNRLKITTTVPINKKSGFYPEKALIINAIF